MVLCAGRGEAEGEDAQGPSRRAAREQSRANTATCSRHTRTTSCSPRLKEPACYLPSQKSSRPPDRSMSTSSLGSVWHALPDVTLRSGNPRKRRPGPLARPHRAWHRPQERHRRSSTTNRYFGPASSAPRGPRRLWRCRASRTRAPEAGMPSAIVTTRRNPRPAPSAERTTSNPTNGTSRMTAAAHSARPFTTLIEPSSRRPSEWHGLRAGEGE